MRLFIALEVPETTRRSLNTMIDLMKAQYSKNHIRWAADYDLHLTVVYIGEVNNPDVKTIEDMLAEKMKLFPYIHTHFTELGLFPPSKHPKVIAGRIELVETLEKLRHLCEAGLREEGFILKHQAFKPHITLGRIRHIPHMRPVVFKDDVTFKTVVLYKSVTHHDGAVYTPLSSYPLIDE